MGIDQLQELAGNLQFSYMIEKLEVEADHVVVTFRMSDDDDVVPESRVIYIDPRLDPLGEQILLVLHQICNLVDDALVAKRRPMERRPTRP